MKQSPPTKRDLLKHFRRYGTGVHSLFASTYTLNGWTYTDRSCLPPRLRDPEGQPASAEDYVEREILQPTTE